MTASSPHRLRPVMLWSLAAVLALFCIGSLVFVLFRTAEESWSYLPAKETVALFHALTPERRAQLEPSFPILRATPPSPAPVDVAVLVLSDNTMGWVSFTREQTPAVAGGDQVGPFTVTASSPSFRSLIKRDTDRLGGNGTFLALTSHLAPSLSFVVLDVRLLALPLTATDQALSSQLPSPFILAAWDGPRTLLRTTSPASLPAGPAPSLPALSPAPTVSVASANPKTAPSSLLSNLPTNQRIVLQGLLSGKLSSLLGTDASPAYDLAPLLAAPTTLSSTTTSSGTLHFLLQGQAPVRTLQDKLATIHQSFRAALPSSTIKHRILTNGFSAVTAEDNESIVKEETRKQGLWTIRTTAQEGGASLTSAVAEGKFLLGNDDAWLTQAMGGSGASLPLPHFTVSPFLGGEADRTAITSFFRSLVPSTLVSTLLPTLGPSGNRLLWSVEQGNGILTIVVQGK